MAIDAAAKAESPRRLRSQRDFRRFWTGDLVSQFGSRITEFVLPLLVVTVLDGSGTQVGLLQACYMAPFFLLPLFAGVWLDRRTKRPVMIVMDFGRFVLVMAVPLLALFGFLTLPLLYVVAIAGGVMTVLYDIAATSYVPRLVSAQHLTSANSAVSVNLAVSATAGPGLAGWLSGLFGPAGTLVFDGLSYLTSANALLLIRHREVVPERKADRDPRRELTEGLHAVLRNPPVRALVTHAGIYNAGSAMIVVAFLIYFVRVLGHDPAVYGAVMVASGIGGIVGSLGIPILIRRLGYGRSLLVSLVFSTSSYFLLPLADGGSGDILICGIGLFLGVTGSASGSVIALTVRQRSTPSALHARMNASYRLISFGMLSIGAGTAGFLVDAFGARAVLFLAPCLLVLSAVPAASRPIRTLRTLPDLG
ncbi:MFS transporter [Amycolatopsis alba DSM 44262]|uniref:MFS transporter n=2 Tax=Amycolatopsis alba TaxID=76020 RepID=A0A229REW4_AMYAL|nr:MFS transporter [Amycolatopsis alba DSM 44262]